MQRGTGAGTVGREGVKPNFCPIWSNSVSRESRAAAAAAPPAADFVRPLYYAAGEGAAA